MEKKTYKFKYRLTQKSSLSTIAKAVRALGYDMAIKDKGFNFGWWKSNHEALTGRLYHQHFVLDENLPEWLNEQLEAAGLLEKQETI